MVLGFNPCMNNAKSAARRMEQHGWVLKQMCSVTHDPLYKGSCAQQLIVVTSNRLDSSCGQSTLKNCSPSFVTGYGLPNSREQVASNSMVRYFPHCKERNFLYPYSTIIHHSYLGSSRFHTQTWMQSVSPPRALQDTQAAFPTYNAVAPS